MKPNPGHQYRRNKHLSGHSLNQLCLSWDTIARHTSPACRTVVFLFFCFFLIQGKLICNSLIYFFFKSRKSTICISVPESFWRGGIWIVLGFCSFLWKFCSDLFSPTYIQRKWYSLVSTESHNKIIIFCIFRHNIIQSKLWLKKQTGKIFK